MQQCHCTRSIDRILMVHTPTSFMWLAIIMHATAPSLWPSSPARAASPVAMALSTDGIDYSGIVHDQMSTSPTSALRQLGLEVGVTEQLLDAAFDGDNPRGALIRLIRARLWHESSYAHTLGHIFVDQDRLEQFVLVPLPDAALSDMMGRAVWNGVKATGTPIPTWSPASTQAAAASCSSIVASSTFSLHQPLNSRKVTSPSPSGSIAAKICASPRFSNICMQPQWLSGVSSQKAYVFVDGDAMSAATSRTEIWPELTSTEAAVVDIVAKLSLLTTASAAILSASAAVADVDTYIFSKGNEVNATQVQMPMQEPLPEIIREMGGFDASFDKWSRTELMTRSRRNRIDINEHIRFLATHS